MIGQIQKPLQEILGYLNGKSKVAIYGCGGCASVLRTGGRREVRKMALALSEHGKEVTAVIGVPPGEFTCYAPQTVERLTEHREQLGDSDAVLVLACGDGAQVVREIIEEDLGLFKPVYSGVDTLGLMGGGPLLFQEKCRQCGECVLGKFAGICPLTQCPKGLLNGPCGGSKNGKCEVDPNHDCAWLMIYEHLRKFNKLKEFEEDEPLFKNYNKEAKPHSIELQQPRGAQ